MVNVKNIHTLKQNHKTMTNNQDITHENYSFILKKVLTHSYIYTKLFVFIFVFVSCILNGNYKSDKTYASTLLPDYIQGADSVWSSTRKSTQIWCDTLTKSSLTKELFEKNKSATLMFTGDLMCLAGQQFAAETKSGYNFYPSYKLVASLFNSADFVCGNLETLISKSNPITKIQKNIDGAPQCNGPESYLLALRRAGFDCVVTANNHCCDWGAQGIIETQQYLDKFGFAHVGTSYEIDQNFVIFQVKNIKIAILSYTHLINQRGKMSSLEMSSMVSQYDINKVKLDIAAAKENGAEFVVVYCHWGVENTESLTSYQRSDAKAIAEAGADLIIGSHPHCLQGKEIIETSDNRSVVCMYSMGNFVSSMVRDINNDTIILTLNLYKNSKGEITVRNIDYIPCHVMSMTGYSSFTIVPTQAKYNGGITNSTLSAAEERIRKIIGTFDF